MFYNNELRHHRRDDGHKHMYFYSTKGIMSVVNNSLLSAGDTKCCKMLYHQIRRRNANANVQILTYYRAQARDIQRVLQNAAVCCIDGFQGEEADEVIIALTSRVRSYGPSKFARDVKRMNVAISRARNNLYVVGNIRTMENTTIWRDFIAKCICRYIY